LIERTQPQMTWPLGSTPTAPSRSFIATTGQSASAPRDGTQSLAGFPLGSLPLATSKQQFRDALSHVPRKSSRSGSRRLYAGHHLASKRAPARLIPGPDTKPWFRCHLSYIDTSTANPKKGLLVQRLPDPHLTSRNGRLFPHRSPRQSSANAAEGGLTSPPRRATPEGQLLHLSRSTTSRNLAYIKAPLCVRDTHIHRGIRTDAATMHQHSLPEPIIGGRNSALSGTREPAAHGTRLGSN
jgi:hypothetical protein